jgi:hypothetical protein
MVNYGRSVGILKKLVVLLGTTILIIVGMQCRIVDCMKYSHSKAMAVLYKLVKLAKNGVLMIIHIYAKVSHN